jgi:hypothetical protein
MIKFSWQAMQKPRNAILFAYSSRNECYAADAAYVSVLAEPLMTRPDSGKTGRVGIQHLTGMRGVAKPTTHVRSHVPRKRREGSRA